VLRLKAAKSFLETSQCTYFTEKSGLEMRKEQILSDIGEDPD